MSKRKILALLGGTGCGKSYYAPIWLYTKMMENPGYEWIVSAPTIPMMKRTVVKYIKRFCIQNGMDHGFHKGDMIFDWGPLGIIHCISALNADRMEGVHAKGIVGDECGKFGKEWYDTAVQRIALLQGQLLLVSTPYSMNWLYSDVYQKARMGDDQICMTNPTSVDNPHYPLESFLDAKKRLPSWKFKMRFLGKFTKPAGLIYPRYTLCKRFEIPKSWFRVRSLDFGFNDPSASLSFAQSPHTKRWYCYRELKRSGMDYNELAKKMKEERSYIYADPSEKQGIQTLMNRGINILKAENAVKEGLIETYTALNMEQVVIFDDLLLLIDELMAYQWKMNRQEQILDIPEAGNDHLMDCLRYFWYSLLKNGYPMMTYVDKASSDGEIDLSGMRDNIFDDDD